MRARVYNQSARFVYQPWCDRQRDRPTPLRCFRSSWRAARPTAAPQSSWRASSPGARRPCGSPRWRLAVSVGGRGCTREGVQCGWFFRKDGGFIYEVFLMLVGWVTLVDVGRLGGWLVGWLAGWLVCWLVGREVGDFFFWLVVVIICCSLLFLLAFLIVPAIFWYMLALSVFFCHLNSLCFVFFTRVLRR